MLSSVYGSVEVEGTRSELLADFIILIKSFYDNDIFTKEDIEYAVKFADKSREEIAEEANCIKEELKKTDKKEAIRNFLDELREAFSD